MGARASLVAATTTCGLLAACSADHRFDVAIDDPAAERAELTLYGETTSMVRTERGFAGTRRNRADGSGRIVIYRSNGGPINCPIGYVTSGEDEPHRFVVRNSDCAWVAAPRIGP
jgi:hypothetical protein